MAGAFAKFFLLEIIFCYIYCLPRNSLLFENYFAWKISKNFLRTFGC